MSITGTGVGYTGSSYTFTGVGSDKSDWNWYQRTADITINNGGATMLQSTLVVLVIKSVIFWNQSLLVMMDLVLVLNSLSLHLLVTMRSSDWCSR